MTFPLRIGTRRSMLALAQSGMMQRAIAAALGVPAVGIFGPTTRELGFFPYGPGNTVVETPLACRPCALHGSKTCPRGHFLCMRLLTVNEVFRAAQDCRKSRAAHITEAAKL